jgi:hypothetical protein
MSLRPSRRLPWWIKARNVVRNLWHLRRELWRIIRRKPVEQPEAIPLRCEACGHELTKPCRRGRWKHVIRWPEGVAGHPAGTLVEVARQKPRGGEYRPDHDLRALKR